MEAQHGSVENGLCAVDHKALSFRGLASSESAGPETPISLN